MSDLILSTYEILEKIGSGGGGVVYLANHHRLGKKVVLKADKRKITAKPEILRREVDVLKNLNHTYIPQVYDYFIENDTVYTVMDFVQGESLDKPLKRGETFSQAQVIKWAIQLLEALDYLHSPIHGDPPKGYVHSDIKPANIMRKPNNDISLIDFNIALAIGEENVVGCSAGYASPEHYGLDYSFMSGTSFKNNETVTMTLTDETSTLSLSNLNSTITLSDINNSTVTSEKKKIIPDVRSDIYSVGATLYHLLCGNRPSKSAIDVVPLSSEIFSSQIVDIISKAMQPNPDLRYQTAKEMLTDLKNLKINDKRTKRLNKFIRISSTACLSVFLIGILVGFTGLKRIQTKETWLKLAEYSEDSLREGDSLQAIKYALDAFPNHKNIFTPNTLPEVEQALTDAVGVYNLSDGYKPIGKVTLPSSPLDLRISPNGFATACIYSGKLAVIDNNTEEILLELPVDSSALSEVEFVDDTTLCFAGDEGISLLDLSSKSIKWTGEKATAICISSDKSKVAGVYKDNTYANVYDMKSGKVLSKIDFSGKSQSVVVNDIFANPNDNLFELNYDGTKLAVSFSDGSLLIYDIFSSDDKDDIELFDSSSGYKHFEGGFNNNYFAFSASNKSDSVFAVIDTETKEQLGGFDKKGYFGVQANESGIYVETDNLLVQVEPISGDQTPLITTAENVFDFSHSYGNTITAYNGGVMFFNDKAQLISKIEKNMSCDFVDISNDFAVVGSRDEPNIYIFKYENNSESNFYKYDISLEHDEVRISADYKTLMFFSYKQFVIYDVSGKLISKTNIPNASEVYDQQFRRENGSSYLEVIYNDGTRVKYSAANGKIISTDKGEIPDLTLYEEFFTEKYRIKSPLHGTPKVFDKKSGDLIKELDEDAYLTYVTEVGDYIITQYVTASSEYYGYLLNDKCEVIGTLPYLCDIIDGDLIFDYPTGDIKKSKIYTKDEMKIIAQEFVNGGI